MVRAEGVCKRFGRLEVLKGIDLEVQPGEVSCVIGPSGSGKSTFLRCINHLEKVDAGRLYVDGELVGTTSSQTPQPAPVPLQHIGHVAAQFRDAFGDDRGVLEVRAIPGEVLVLPATVHQHRVHTDQLHPTRTGPVQQRLPAM
ncbi:ATP-binding cassette domain-containing protein, partial [Kibdelosporangium lantanae]